MLFVKETVKTEELNNIQDFFTAYDKEIETVTVNEINVETPVSKYISSLVSSRYQQSVEDIENTEISSSRRLRKRSLQQVMKESFFAGANRFGNNFIA